ncbi:hypothetical protein MMC10_000976 [Thelotrema lepadinum]|nr:hypothetical protein [Thelotrema lepadinum]
MSWGGSALNNQACANWGAGITFGAGAYECQKLWRESLRKTQERERGGLKKRDPNNRRIHPLALPATRDERRS